MKKFAVSGVLVATLPVLAGFSPATSPGTADDEAQRERTVRTTSSGLVIQELKQGDVTITTFGRSAPRVRFDRNQQSSAGDARGEAMAAVEFAADDSASAPSGSEIGPTVYEMTLASGNFTPREACEFAQGIDPYGCKTSAEVREEQGLALAPVYDSRCFEFRTTEGDGEKWSHNCNVRRIDSQTSAYVYISNQMKATGGEDNTGWNADGISGVGIRADYHHDSATAVDWEPSESRPYSACNERTVTVQGRHGASYSSSATVCDDKLAPWHSPAFQYFGSKWTGPEAPRHDTRSTIAASLHRVPSGGTRGYTITAWLHWN